MLQLMWRTRCAGTGTHCWRLRTPERSLRGRRNYAKPVSGLFDDEKYWEDLEDSVENEDKKIHKQFLTFLGVATTNSPSTVTLQELVQKLGENTYGKWLDPGHTLLGHTSLGHTSLELTLLFTPSYAQSALSSETPLQILARLSNGPFAPNSLDVIAAVVDRLPTAHDNANGSEGLAYYIRLGRSPWKRVFKSLEASAQKPGSLEFTAGRSYRTWRSNAVIQLPLAQTVFSTTLPSTLVHTRYRFSETLGKHEVRQSSNLETFTVPILMKYMKKKRDHIIPLIPVTPGRRVENSMGNIVRKLSASLIKDESRHTVFEGQGIGSSIPASQELESAISSYFQELHLQPEPVQVWALIVPSGDSIRQEHGSIEALLSLDERTIRDLWKTAPSGTNTEMVTSIAQMVNDSLPALLAKGGRLCKVLSGGGGWGKKAGLLSLDPDTSYSTRDLRHDRGWEFSFDDDDSPQAIEKQQKQALGEVVKEGEGVMFFLAPKQAPHAQDISFTEKSDRKLVFGALPSSIDEAPMTAEEELNAAAAGAGVRIEHHEGLFGMLSEGGMALKQGCRALDGHHYPTESKLDVPHAKVIMTSDTDTKTSEASRPDPEDEDEIIDLVKDYVRTT